MVIGHGFDLEPQNSLPRFVPREVLYKVETNFPCVTPVWVDGCGYIKQVLNVYILQHNPPCLSEPRFVRINDNRQPAEVKIPDRAKEWRRLWISGAEVVSDWRQHCDEAVAPVRQRKNAKCVEDVPSVGDPGKKPVEGFLVDALGKESDHSEEVAGGGAEGEECRGSEREFDGRSEALVVVICLEDLHPLGLPLLR